MEAAAAAVGFMMGLESNRIVSTLPHTYEKIGKVEHIPEDGLFTHLKGFDFINVFRTVDTEGHPRHYCMYLPDKETDI